MPKPMAPRPAKPMEGFVDAMAVDVVLRWTRMGLKDAVLRELKDNAKNNVLV